MSLNASTTSSTDKPTLKGISILILDRDRNSQKKYKDYFSNLGTNIYFATHLDFAHKTLNTKMVHAVLADTGFIENGLKSLLDQFRESTPQGVFYLMTSDSNFLLPPTWIDQEVVDVFSNPPNLEQVSVKLKNDASPSISSVSKLDPLTELLRPYLVFRAFSMRQCLMALPRMAATTHSILITGETGTGKEMVAHAIHGLSSFASGPFIAVNCGAIPENLIEGELFGHEKGSFTGAQGLHKGKFELAKNGTLFLDEIGEMPLALQARLLRVLEERRFYRIGGEKPISTNLRIVAATQVNLEKSIENGLFREDLYYRLNVLRLHIPPLRERTEDIPLLAWHFFDRIFNEINRPKPVPTLSKEFIQLLTQIHWKGNVRELRNVVTRIAILLPNGVDSIRPEYLSRYFPENPDLTILKLRSNNFEPAPAIVEDKIIEIVSNDENEGVFIPIGTTMKQAEEMIIQNTLRYTGENRTKTANLLGIGLRTVRRKLNNSN